MPFRSGSLSARRYLLQEAPAEGYTRTATMAVRRHSWRPINAEKGEVEAFGWVNPRNLLGMQFTFEELQDGNLVFIGVRRDRKNLNKHLFNARKNELFEKTKRERKVERLSRQQRLALEEQLRVEMLKVITPVSAFTELVWDTNSGEVFIGATSKSLCERIADLFLSTFDVRIAPQFPALIGYRFITEQGLEENFDQTVAAAESSE